jgi:Tol biopolymer transport system component
MRGNFTSSGDCMKRFAGSIVRPAALVGSAVLVGALAQAPVPTWRTTAATASAATTSDAAVPSALTGGDATGVGSPPLFGQPFGYVSGSQSASKSSVSDDGHYVAYVGGQHIFVQDTESSTAALLLDQNGGTAGNGGSTAPAISGDGRYVAFESSATDLVSGDAAGGVFVADIQTGAVTRASVDSTGADLVANPIDTTAISGDGRYVVFVLDNPTCDAFTYQATDPFGNAVTLSMYDGGTGYVWDRTTGTSQALPGCVSAPTISSNGAVVAFTSPDSDGISHVYGWDNIAKSSLGVLSLGSDGDVRSGHFPSLSADGTKVAFVTGSGIDPGGSLGWAEGIR